MIITQECIQLIKQFEGCKLKAYRDLNGIWTIGYGCTQGVSEGQTITQSQAEVLLFHALTQTADQVKKCMKRKLTANQFSAVISLVYNIGIGNFRMSLLKRCLEFGHMADAASEFLRWNKVNDVEVHGLTLRRQAEKALFLTPESSPSLKPVGF